MNDIKKFLFDLHDFDEESLARKRKAAEAPKPPSFSEAELESARAQAYQKGRIAGIDEERKSINQRVADTIAGFQIQFDTLYAQEEGRNTRFVDDSIALVLDSLQKAFPTLFEASKIDELEAFLKNHIAGHIKTPMLDIRVHPSLKDEINKRMAEILAHSPLSGDWSVSGDSAIQPGHCKILWAHGGAEWVPMALHHTILAFFKEQLGANYEPYIAPPAPMAAPAPLTPPDTDTQMDSAAEFGLPDRQESGDQENLNASAAAPSPETGEDAALSPAQPESDASPEDAPDAPLNDISPSDTPPSDKPSYLSSLHDFDDEDQEDAGKAP